MTDKAKLALVGAVAAVIFASPALAQTINGGDETGNASPYSYQPAASDAAVRHAGRSPEWARCICDGAAPAVEFRSTCPHACRFRRSGAHWRRQHWLQRIAAAGR